MIKRMLPLVGFLFIGFVVAWAYAEDLGQRRVQDMNGRWYVGQVEQLADSYKIKMSSGITVTLKKSEVKAILPVEEQPGVTPTPKEAPKESGDDGDLDNFRRYVEDAEIEELLAGLTIDDSDTGDITADPFAELPLNEESLEEMKRLAGSNAKSLQTKHFLLVYTGLDSEARRLTSRLERVWEWNLKYLEMLGVKFHPPEHKLEIYFFSSQKEFDAYQTNTGGQPRPGVLGFFTPFTNRSAFFDLNDWEFLEGARRLIADKTVNAHRRQLLRNYVHRWVEYENMDVIQHETGHHIHFSIGLFPADVFMDVESYDTLPRWLVEGTTMMFEVPPGKSGGSLGAVNQGRLYEFRKYYLQHKFSPDFVKRFIMDNSVWFQGGGSSYPLGWAMVFYLWREHRPEFCKYMRMVSSREPGVEVTYTQREKDFEDHFGHIDDKWVDQWYDFIKNLPFRPSEAPPDIFP